MTRKLFGTDGIRGKANVFPMTADVALKVAMATAQTLKHENGGLHQYRAIIGKDTRVSCYMLEQAMAAGFEAMGMEVIFLGPLPTPAIAQLTRSLRADIGVMISASHNPYQDNGIKLFGSDGYKLPDDIEEAIENRIAADLTAELPVEDHLGRASRLDDAPGRYIEFVKNTLPKGMNLEGLKIVIDCANGAAYKVAPKIFWELEAGVEVIANQPNGKNINEKCGATDTRWLEKTVLEKKADIGVALDGDADRLILVDETGHRIDGDQILALLALNLKEQGSLKGDGVVSTVMSNLGLERFLADKDIKLERTPVGDRHVVSKMKETGFVLGGEQSGHIILSDYSTTGDGLLAAAQILSVLKMKDKKASEVLHLFDPLPQILKNVPYKNKDPLHSEKVLNAIEAAEKSLANDGRLLVRASGTEPLIRVMAEGDDSKLVETIVQDLCGIIESVS
jgi:phosphoglucosamine mutase